MSTETEASSPSLDSLPESKGTPIHLWESWSWEVRFVPFPKSERLTIYIPAGWSLVSDPDFGVALSNVWGERFTAAEAVGRFHGER